jgi:hypothetical protein
MFSAQAAATAAITISGCEALAGLSDAKAATQPSWSPCASTMCVVAYKHHLFTACAVLLTMAGGSASSAIENDLAIAEFGHFHHLGVGRVEHGGAGWQNHIDLGACHLKVCSASRMSKSFNASRLTSVTTPTLHLS